MGECGRPKLMATFLVEDNSFTQFNDVKSDWLQFDAPMKMNYFSKTFKRFRHK